MSDEMRKMLDELMGTNRDGLQDTNAVKFSSSNVCKSFLLGLCPYDLFHNTGTFKSSKKLDLGICSKLHDPALKADYELAAADQDYEYEIEQLEQITQFVNDCDRKVAVNKRRLEETQDQETLGPEAQAVHELNEQIGIKLAEAEELGAAGKVEESMAMLIHVEDLKNNKRKAEDIYRNSVPATQNQQQKLRVCEICAAFLSLYDNDRRLADHFGGRLHMGFIKVRERLEELEKIVAKKREDREKEREKRREEREKNKSAERDRDRYSRDRESRNSRDRDRERERDKERERDRDRDRDRDKERDRRESRDSRRDRDRDRRRSRSRSRDRERRRKRSRSRERRRSRSRDRSRDRRRERDRSSSRDSRRKDRSRERTRDRSRERTRDRSRERERSRGSSPKDMQYNTTEKLNEEPRPTPPIDEAVQRNIAEEGEVVDTNERIAVNHVVANHESNKELSVTEYLNSEDFPTNGEDTYEEMSNEIPRPELIQHES